MSTIAGIGFNTGDVGGDLSVLANRLQRFHAMGCEVAEITAVGLDAVTACRLVPERIEAIRAILADVPLTTTMHAPIAINLMDEAHIALHKAAALASLDLAAALGAKVVVLHPGRVHPDLWATDATRLLELERTILTRVGDTAGERGLLIAYENISPNERVIAGLETSYSLDPRQLAAQLASLDHQAVWACLDISHAQQGALLWDFDMLEACRALGPHIIHLHYSDSTGRPATIASRHKGEAQFFGVGDMHAPPGWGAIDFDALADAVTVRAGSRIVIELKPNYHHHAAQTTLAAARRFAARMERVPA
ncbi:MAG: sugar phosphate isomerase/epimerase [Pseudomonadota bacterium]